MIGWIRKFFWISIQTNKNVAWIRSNNDCNMRWFLRSDWYFKNHSGKIPIPPPMQHWFIENCNFIDEHFSKICCYFNFHENFSIKIKNQRLKLYTIFLYRMEFSNFENSSHFPTGGHFSLSIFNWILILISLHFQFQAIHHLTWKLSYWIPRPSIWNGKLPHFKLIMVSLFISLNNSQRLTLLT